MISKRWKAAIKIQEKIKEESEKSNKTCSNPHPNSPGNFQKCEATSFSLFMIFASCLFKHHVSDKICCKIHVPWKFMCHRIWNAS